MRKIELSGVVIYKTQRAGTRWRSVVPLANRGSLYGGSFNTPQEAGEASDDIRYWLYRTGLVPRAPKLNYPARFEVADPAALPPCPAKVQELADEVTAEDKKRIAVGGTMNDLLDNLAAALDRILSLEVRVATLERGPQKLRTLGDLPEKGNA